MKLNLKKYCLPAAILLAAVVTTPAQASYICTGYSSSTGDFFDGDLTDSTCDLDNVNTALGTSLTVAEIIGSKSDSFGEKPITSWSQDQFGLGTLVVSETTDTSGTWILTDATTPYLFFVDKYDSGYDIYTYMGGDQFSGSWDGTNRGTIAVGNAQCTTGTGLVNCGATTSHISVYSTVVPVPAAVWLFGSGLLGLIGLARRKKV